MSKTNTAEVIRVLDYHPSEGDLKQEILAGLSKAQKTLPPKYFYDEAGSHLFDEITELTEYYPTRTEIEIVEQHVNEMAALIGPQASLIEFGSGSSAKTGRILDAMHQPAAYVPVEISKSHLLAAAQRIAADHPNVEVLPVCADFTRSFELPTPEVMPKKNVVFFPGSTIGNFYPDDALKLLQTMSRIAKLNGGLLIGVDLKKKIHTLEAAYNDARGITARFNMNMLVRLNREMGADFKLAQFQHRAIYNEVKGRIEMHLVSLCAQQVEVSGTTFEFKQGEYILSECSHKYSVIEFAQLAKRAGFDLQQSWEDEQGLFSVQYFKCVV